MICRISNSLFHLQDQLPYNPTVYPNFTNYLERSTAQPETELYNICYINSQIHSTENSNHESQTLSVVPPREHYNTLSSTPSQTH